jgi:hypothetical protein
MENNVLNATVTKWLKAELSTKNNAFTAKTATIILL